MTDGSPLSIRVAFRPNFSDKGQAIGPPKMAPTALNPYNRTKGSELTYFQKSNILELGKRCSIAEIIVKQMCDCTSLAKNLRQTS